MRSNSPNKREREAGFTLLEVLIAIVIMAFISMVIYQAITETYKVRETLSNEGDFYNGIRLAMNILQRDVTLLYSPVALIPPSPSPSPGAQQPQTQQPPVGANGQTDPELAQTFEYWGPASDKLGTRPSHFIGTENKLTFVANSHLRVYKETQESEFAKIGYELTKDDADPNSQMLVKVENTDVFTREAKTRDPTERRYPLLHGIKKLKYRFYRKDKDEWGPKWDSDIDEFKDPSGRYLYPDIIEVTLQVAGPLKLQFEGRFLFRPELPLRALNPSQ